MTTPADRMPRLGVLATMPVLLGALVLTAPAALADSTGLGDPRAAALGVRIGYGPQLIAGDDGRDHIVMTAELQNLLDIPVMPDGITVRAGDGRRLTHLGPQAVQSRMEGVYATLPMPDGIPAGGTAVVTFDTPVTRPVDAVRVQVHSGLAPGIELSRLLSWVGIKWWAASPRTPLLPQTAMVIDPPVHGATWINQNACCMPSSHETTRLSSGQGWRETEMFGIDFIRAANGRTSAGDGARNEQYAAWNRPVYSATAGTVVSTRNDMPDIPPGTDPAPPRSFFEFSGNHVLVRVAPHVYALYAHFRQGTVRVKVGQRVSAGTPLARLGNSGHTTEPHLHFQLTDTPALTGGTGLPFVFRSYTRVGTPAPTADGGLRISGRATAQRDTYPLALGAYRFPR